MILMPCPFLKEWVRLSAEREAHVRGNHSAFGSRLRDLVRETLADPDEIRWSRNDEALLLFWRWYPAVLGGKHVAVVVVLDSSGRTAPWIVTAYVARKLVRGAVAWRRN